MQQPHALPRKRGIDVIDLDITLAIQSINFIITLVVLNYLLIKPVREQLTQRRATVKGLEDEVNAFVASANEKLRGYEETLAHARESATRMRAEAREAAEIAGLEVLGQAAHDAQATLQAAQAATRAEVAKTRESLTGSLTTFTDAALAKLLA